MACKSFGDGVIDSNNNAQQEVIFLPGLFLIH